MGINYAVAFIVFGFIALAIVLYNSIDQQRRDDLFSRHDTRRRDSRYSPHRRALNTMALAFAIACIIVFMIGVLSISFTASSDAL